MRLFLCTIIALLILTPLPSTADSLVRPGYRLVKSTEDDSELQYGGAITDNGVSGDCSYNTFTESCGDVSGIEVASYIIDGDTVTRCGRYRTEMACVSHNLLGSTATTTESYGGARTTFNAVPAAGEVATLHLPATYDGNGCSDVCTDLTSGSLTFSNYDDEQCEVAEGWYIVNRDFEEACAVKQVCEELQIVSGCEGSYMGSIAGMYQPEVRAECGKGRSVYTSDNGMTLLYTDEWVVGSLCNANSCSCEKPNLAYWDAGHEPYMNPEYEVKCYDGGYGSDREYDYTPLSIRCNNKATTAASGSRLGPNSSSGVTVLKICIGLMAIFLLCWCVFTLFLLRKHVTDH